MNLFIYSFTYGKTVPPKYIKFTKTSFVSIGFASENLDSVVSSFGHTFLIFHNQPIPEAHSIVYEFYGNLGVDYYLLKSLVGLPGQFKFNYFQNRRLSYGQENRDLWVFRLNLNLKERENLNKIILNQIGQDFTYYFFTKNCSWYVYQTLIESFEKKNCQNWFYTPPLDTVVWLRECDRLGRSFLIKSSAHLTETVYNSLNFSEKQKIKSINFQNKPNIRNFSDDEKKFLSNFLNYKIPRTRHSFMRDKMIKWKMELAPHVEHHPLIEEKKFVAPKTSSIHSGYDPLNKNFLFGFYPALLFFEGASRHHFWSDELKLFSMDFIFNKKTFLFKKFILFGLNTKQSKSLINKGFVRIVKLGYERFQFKTGFLEQNTFKIGMGKTWMPFHGLKISGLMGGETGYYKRNFQDFGVAPFLRSELDINLMDFVRMNFSYENYLNLNKFKFNQINFKLAFVNQSNFSLSLDSTIIDNKKNSELFFKINYLFN